MTRMTRPGFNADTDRLSILVAAQCLFLNLNFSKSCMMLAFFPYISHPSKKHAGSDIITDWSGLKEGGVYMYVT